MDRAERIKSEIETAYKTIKVERNRNLNLISDSTLRAGGKIPSIKTILKKIDAECQNWNEMKGIIAILREMRFLGFPKRTEISSALLNRLSELYAADSNHEALIGCLEDLISVDEMNPLIFSEDIKEGLSDDDCTSSAYKTVIYTLQDMNNKL